MSNQVIDSAPHGFLHIGKTAGTAIRSVIAQHNRQASPEARVEVFTHEMTLPHICSIHPNMGVSFFVRDPVQRFVSGFNSRLRHGRPRYNVPWTPEEQVAFTRFPTANALGESLGSTGVERQAAEAAMLSIYHARLNLVHYLHSVDSLEEHRDQIVFIGRTECFTDDLEAFKRRLGIGREIHAPQDAVGAHKNPDNLDRNLSDIASSNLQQWHDEDYLIYHWCLDRRRMLLGG